MSLKKYLQENSIVIIEDNQLRRNVGIFRSLPLIAEELGANFLVVSVYRNIQKYMILPNFKAEYKHFKDISHTTFSALVIYAKRGHELQYLITSCLKFDASKIIVVENAKNYPLPSGRSLIGIFSVIPLKYEDLWWSYWSRNNPPLKDTRNLAFQKAALALGVKGSLLQLFSYPHITKEPLKSWHQYLTKCLKNHEDWEKLLRYWIENEKTIKSLIEKLKMIKI